ncbi:translation initiation factor eIF-2B subunit epsilon [Leptopilina boulardi]|uniref:translation initiation factor eIF-2B subunit epsilon n=1 Tax=Leptopilina boulardi TaxID=63433 RepID=UPI0021F507C5|nr:translation initiation factor eIF-2B subunit epsilon [Leptopilina boulardi]
MSKTASDRNTKLGKNDVLQAIVFADDFTTQLSPLENVLPSILLPVLNTPLLQYLIETLVASRVQEVFLYCSNHIDLLKNYIKSLNQSDIIITPIISDGCRSLGDALRDIDIKGWVRGDFILIRGDVFTNVDLKRLITSHRCKTKKDPGNSMTLLLSNFGNLQNSCLEEETCLLVSNNEDNKVLLYKKMRKEKKIQMELQWFLDHENLRINSGLLDSHVYFCSPAVLPLFSDNFDFQTMEDFIKGVLLNEEILNSRIYWESPSPTEYALPVTSWKAYHKLTRDILQRQAYPLSLDLLNFFKNYSCLSILNSTYKHQTATISRGSSLKNNSIIGENSIINGNCNIIRTIIAGNCQIGNKTNLENCYIFNDTKIGNECNLKDCLIMPNCKLDNNINLNNCIVIANVKLTKCEYIDKIISDENGEIIVDDIFEPKFLEAGEEFLFYSERGNKNIDDDEESNEDSSSEASYGASIPDDVSIFLSEVIDSLSRGYQDKLNCENLILEINSSRYAYNMAIREVTYNVIKAILGLPAHYLKNNDSPLSDDVYRKTLKGMLIYFKKIIINYMKTEDSQEDCLRAIEDVANTTKALLPFTHHLLHFLYDCDTLSEEKIIEWYENDLDEKEANVQALKKAVMPFIKWLQEAEEDSSSDEN